MQMQYLSEVPIPPCMIGTWAWGSGMNGSKMIFGKSYDEEALKEAFCVACDNGFVLWDTAEVYGMGNSEKILGECIKNRNDILIFTKHMPDKKYQKGAMEKALENSCQRLGIAAPDLYWIHLPFNIEKNITDAICLLKQGKIKNLGVSNYSLDEIKKAEEMLEAEGFHIAAVQNHFSLLCMSEEELKIIDWCKNHHVIYFSYMVLEQGALSGHYSEKNPFPTVSLRGLAFSKSKFKKIKELLSYEKELAEKYHTDTSQIPIAWAIAKGTVPIIGITKEKYARQLKEATQISLSDEEIKTLEAMARKSKVTCKGIWEPRR